MTTDPRIDAYIARAAPFAQPILTHLRALVHRALPEAVETVKWGMPHFTVAGKNVAGLAAFKAHCAFVVHGSGRHGGETGDGMGQYGKIHSLAELPQDDTLVEVLHAARDRVLSEGSAVKRKAAPAAKPPLETPAALVEALAGNDAARAHYAAFSASAKREYDAWIAEAKSETTRDKRVAQAIEWIAQGKKRNWKYER